MSDIIEPGVVFHRGYLRKSCNKCGMTAYKMLLEEREIYRVQRYSKFRYVKKYSMVCSLCAEELSREGYYMILPYYKKIKEL